MSSNHTFTRRHDCGSIRPSGAALRPDESAIMPSPSGMIDLHVSTSSSM